MRDEDLSTKKFKEIQLLKSGKLNTFGFAGAQLMGMSAQSGNAMGGGGTGFQYNSTQ